MMTRITVAEGGDPHAPFMDGLKHPEDFERPWDERHQVQIDVEESDTVASILQRGAEALGSELSADYPFWPFIDFYVEGASIQFRRVLVLVDERGRARWTSRWHDEPYRELLRAHEAGTLVGDPTRIYILRQPGIGNGVLTDLPTWVELLRLMVEAYSACLAARSGYRALRRRVGKAASAADGVERCAERWRANGANANYIWELLQSKRWLEKDLGRVLGAAPEEIEALLECLGFVENEDGTWSIGDDPESHLLAGNGEFIIHSQHAERGWMQTILRQRLDLFLATGEAPSLDWSELTEMRVGLERRARRRRPEEGTHTLHKVTAAARFWLRELREWVDKRRG